MIPWKLLQISDVRDGLSPGTVICDSIQSLIEVCVRQGIILWTIHGSIPRENKLRGEDGEMYCLLPMIVPDSSDPSGVASRPSSIWVSNKLLNEINDHVTGATGDTVDLTRGGSRFRDQDVKNVTSTTVEKTFVYLDVSDFSKQTPAQQALIINSVVHATDDIFWQPLLSDLTPSKHIEARLCIGDGYIFVFHEPDRAVAFAGYFACLTEHLIATDILPIGFHFRIGVHSGPVFRFWDQGRKDWNYIGEGINGGNRVLAAIGKDTDDIVFVSGQVRSGLTTRIHQIPNDEQDIIKKLLDALQNRGRRSDKHGNHWRVYELNHAAVFNESVMSSVRNIQNNRW